MARLEYTACAQDALRRADAVLSGAFPDMTRSFLQQLFAQGLVQCNGARASKSLKVKAGDVFLLEVPQAKPVALEAQPLPLDVVYEDADLIVVNKPKGMVVHPAAGNPDGTLVNALLHHCRGQLSGINGEERPGIVHRIDKDTSGLLVAAERLQNGQTVYLMEASDTMVSEPSPELFTLPDGTALSAAAD